mgnify:CR=1 FL=1
MDNQLDQLTLRISRERESTEDKAHANAFARTVLKAKLAALDAARGYLDAHGGDGGTCNFDSAVICLRDAGPVAADDDPYKRRQEQRRLRMLDALAHGGLRAYVREYGVYEGGIAICSPIAAQGGLNTVQAEAMAKVFEDFGLNAAVSYRMD